MSPAGQIAAKDLKLRLRDRSAFVIGIIAPLALAYIFHLVFGNILAIEELDLQYGLVDLDNSEISQAFGEILADIEADGALAVTDFEDVESAPGPVHPLVRTHPESGRKALYLGRERNGAYRAACVPGMTRAESDRLLDELWAIAREEQFAWYHTWRVGDYLMWDNRCVMHRREQFNGELRRVMHRTQIRDSVAPA